MSVASIATIKDRVMNGRSTLAIFNARRLNPSKHRGTLNAVFANTVECHRWIKKHGALCIVSHTMGDQAVEDALQTAKEECKNDY